MPHYRPLKKPWYDRHSEENNPNSSLYIGGNLSLEMMVEGTPLNDTERGIESTPLNDTSSRGGSLVQRAAMPVMAFLAYASIACSSGGQVEIYDQTKIAFNSYRDGNWEIYIMDADGSGLERLTKNSADEGPPVWSPDGGRIAFNSYRDGNWEIYIMDADGSGQTRLTTNPAYDGPPVWSPDGKKIAFRSDRDGNFEIYVMNADGTGQTRLTKNSADDWAPSWSPILSR